MEAKFKVAISNLYNAFEDAFQFESSDFIEDLSSHLVKNAVTQITSLFASSRCRTCYRGRRMDAAWRLRRFETLLPFLSEVPSESYRRAEDHRANILLDKTSLMADGPPMDKFRLGLTLDDRRTYSSLSFLEKKSFDKELATLVHINSLMQMSRRWDSCKFVSPALDINLGHQAFQKMRQLRRQNLLPVKCCCNCTATAKNNLLIALGNLSHVKTPKFPFFSLEVLCPLIRILPQMTLRT